MPHDHRTIHTSGHTVLSVTIRPVRFHTIVIRSIRFKYELYMVKYDQTRSLRLYKARVWSYSPGAQQTTTCCHIERNPIMPPRKNKAPKRIATSENTKRASKALQPLQPADPIDPDKLGDALVPPDKTSRDSDSDGSSMDPHMYRNCRADEKKVHSTLLTFYLFICLFIFYFYLYNME